MNSKQQKTYGDFVNMTNSDTQQWNVQDWKKSGN